MSAPVIDYSKRAGLNPRPDGYREVADTFAHADVEHAAQWAEATGLITWADIAEFQAVVNSTYPYQQLAIRLDTGGRLDNNASANHSAWLKLKRSGPLIGYLVFIPGQSSAQLKRVRNAFGSQLEGICPMVDMESGSQFAGPGNHSTEANDLVGELASATGSALREIGYANSGDWANLWPSHSPLKHRVIADYTSQLMVPTWFAQQYYGGLDYPTPKGLPRSCKPFGAWVDLNVAATSTDALNESLGLDWFAMATEATLEAAVIKALQSASGKAAIMAAVGDTPVKLTAPAESTNVEGLLRSIHTKAYGDGGVAAVADKNDVAALKKAVAAK